MIKHFFFTPILDYKSGWDTLTFNYIKEFDKKNIVVLCNKKNSKYKYDQYNVLHKPLDYIRNPFLVFLDYFKIKKIFVKYKNYKKYSHFTVEPYSLLLPLISKFFVSNIYYAIGTYSLELKKSIKTNILFYFARKKFNKIIFFSSFTKSNVEKFVDFSWSKTKKIINPIIYLKDNFKKKGKFSKKTILCVGEIKYRKGYHHLINALSVLNNKYKKKFNLILIGKINDQDYKDQLNKLIIKNNLNKNIQFKNNVSVKKIKDYYIKSHIFVLLSKKSGNHFEGFGIVYLEALFYGLPVIISNESGAKDLKKIDKSLKIVSPDNSHNVANEIINALNNKKYKNTKINKKILFNHCKSNKIKLSNFYDKLK